MQGTAFELSHDLGIPYREIDYLAAGINHMAFYLRFERDGEDLYPQLRALAEAGTVPEATGCATRCCATSATSSPSRASTSPSTCRGSSSATGPTSIERFNMPLDEYPRRCVEQIAGWEAERARLEGGEPIEVQPSFEYAATIIRSIETGKPRVIYGNVAERRPDRRPAGRLHGRGAVPRRRQRRAADRIGALPPQLAALIRTNINVQELTVEAALTGRREHVYHAAMLDPHTAAELDLDQIHALVDALLDAHGDWVPPLHLSATAAARP